jgi:CPA2 family monovalent cation:H+ antiporter-2
MVSLLQAAPGVGRLFVDPVETDPDVEGMRHHTIVCGYGRVARELVRALEARRVQYVVIEYNPTLVQELRARKIPVIYGDAGNPAVLEHAHVATAWVLAVLMPDANAAELATRNARAMAPRLHVVARARNAESLERLRRAGATSVVQPEFEAGAEVIQHALHRYGVSGPELSLIARARRAAFYGTDERG